ncbi:hypothetical protein [Nissabacter sp. SGAir0207]|uniref:hypothetical protein n=1 Tax=Nissabacter sp. SGAir0207 TaxID=2126321 RepID=UPI0010CCBA77|nr:hypothetical protein [Nissabacter sp. SGAir0207]QCR36113.1 hypothetical protein C1N62_08425 [Nissabacter sp. SGAir0207]
MDNHCELQQPFENAYGSAIPADSAPKWVMSWDEGGKLHFAEGISKMEKLHSIDQAINDMLTYRDALAKCD